MAAPLSSSTRSLGSSGRFGQLCDQGGQRGRRAGGRERAGGRRTCSWWLSAWRASCAELGPPLPTAAAGFAFPNNFITRKSRRNSLMPERPAMCTSLSEMQPPPQAAEPCSTVSPTRRNTRGAREAFPRSTPSPRQLPLSYNTRFFTHKREGESREKLQGGATRHGR